jgi:uncharacterized repeat protein (TIGR01451 family)
VRAVFFVMRFVLALLLALPLAVSSLAQPADQSIEIAGVQTSRGHAADRVAVGDTVYYGIEYDAVRPELLADTVLEFDAPGTVTEVAHQNNLDCTSGDAVRCTFPPFKSPRSTMVIGVRITQPGVHTAVARIVNHGSASDPSPGNNTSTHTLEAVTAPSLVASIYPPGSRFDPGQSGTFSAGVENQSQWPATNLVLTVTLPDGGAIVSFTSNKNETQCAVETGALVCRQASFEGEGRQFVDVDFTITAPERMDGGEFRVDLAVTSDERDVDPADNQATARMVLVRQIVVSNVADEGGGSLRQAILDANALCPPPLPCAIVFRIPAPVPASGWFTIQPRTPLPELAGVVNVDGKAQTIATGDTNPDGPEIEINGALLEEESGIRLLADCGKDVRGLAVNDFPGYGIQVRRVEAGPCPFEAVAIEENYLGTDPRGRIARPNQRGVGFFGTNGVIANNLISGNLRSGIYGTDAYLVYITGNRIGVAADNTPLGNGASGIFLGGSTGIIRDNVIANNAGSAVARTSAGEIEIVANSMFDNVVQGIDFDIDLRTPNREHDLGLPNHPVLYSATFDPVHNTTLVRGRLDSEGANYFPHFTIHVYASSRLSVWSLPQAERLLQTSVSEEGHQDFEIVVPLDLRGQWITATNTVSHYIGFLKKPGVTGERARIRGEVFDLPTNTSELSDAVFVH